MKALGNLLVVLGVCVGALGAAGMHPPFGSPADGPTTEANAPLAFGLGLASLIVGGLLVRRARHSSAGSSAAEHTRAEALALLTTIRDKVRALDEGRANADGGSVRDAIGALLSEEYFDLTSRSDQLTLQLGFGTYVSVWEGVATAERLLSRCWSMCTDGFPQEGLAELPHARRALEEAHDALSAAG